jgi:hypothetical protein
MDMSGKANAGIVAVNPIAMSDTDIAQSSFRDFICTTSRYW